MECEPSERHVQHPVDNIEEICFECDTPNDARLPSPTDAHFGSAHCEPPIQQFGAMLEFAKRRRGMPKDPTALGGGWFHESDEPSESMECEPCEMDDE